MSAARSEKGRVVGSAARMVGEPRVGAWKPPTLAEVEAMPPLPTRPARGWELRRAAEKTEEARAKQQPAPAAAEEASPAPAQPPPPQPLPRHIDPESAQALVWERAQEAAQVLRTLINEEPQEGQLPPVQRAAILCIALGREVSAEVMKHFSDYEIEEVTQAISGIKSTSAELMDGILKDFEQHLRAGEWASQGGIEFARSMLERAVGPRKAQEIIQRVISKVSSGFYLLKNVAPDQIAPFISHEHPQTIALILSQLEPAQAAGILAQLSERLQADVSYRITTMENITPNVLRQIEESLEASLRDILGGNQDVGGPKVMADILNLTGSSVEKNVLDQMDAQDPEVAESVRNLMFVFADISKLTDREIQVLLREVDQKDLVVALKAASEELKKKIVGNCSEAVQTFITEEMEFLGPMRLSEVEEVQLRIVQTVRQLEEQGQITIVRGDPDLLV